MNFTPKNVRLPRNLSDTLPGVVVAIPFHQQGMTRRMHSVVIVALLKTSRLPSLSPAYCPATGYGVGRRKPAEVYRPGPYRRPLRRPRASQGFGTAVRGTRSSTCDRPICFSRRGICFAASLCDPNIALPTGRRCFAKRRAHSEHFNVRKQCILRRHEFAPTAGASATTVGRDLMISSRMASCARHRVGV